MPPRDLDRRIVVGSSDGVTDDVAYARLRCGANEVPMHRHLLGIRGTRQIDAINTFEDAGQRVWLTQNPRRLFPSPAVRSPSRHRAPSLAQNAATMEHFQDRTTRSPVRTSDQDHLDDSFAEPRASVERADSILRPTRSSALDLEWPANCGTIGATSATGPNPAVASHGASPLRRTVLHRVPERLPQPIPWSFPTCSRTASRSSRSARRMWT